MEVAPAISKDCIAGVKNKLRGEENENPYLQRIEPERKSEAKFVT
jgi:hypothetical protein